MELKVTKKDLVQHLLETGILKEHLLIAVCFTGSHLYNLATEESDFDFKVIYLPSKEDIFYNKKGIEFFNLEINGEVADVQMISFKHFLLDLAKPSLNSLDVLYDENTFVEEFKGRYASEEYLTIYKKLQENVEVLFRTNGFKMLGTLNGHLTTRYKKIIKTPDPAKEYMHFVRIKNILMAYSNHLEMKEYIVTDRSLLVYREPEMLLTPKEYQSKMEKTMEEVNEPKISKTFLEDEQVEEPLKEYIELLINGLFK